jgi:hypothetical protein
MAFGFPSIATLGQTGVVAMAPQTRMALAGCDRQNPGDRDIGIIRSVISFQMRAMPAMAPHRFIKLS